MRRFRRECGLKKARILRERLILVSQGLKIGINRQPHFLFGTKFKTDWRVCHEAAVTALAKAIWI